MSNTLKHTNTFQKPGIISLIMTLRFLLHKPAFTQASMAFNGQSKTCLIASPLLAVLVAHRVFAFWVGTCQKLELAHSIRAALPAVNWLQTNCPPFHHYRLWPFLSFISGVNTSGLFVTGDSDINMRATFISHDVIVHLSPNTDK